MAFESCEPLINIESLAINIRKPKSGEAKKEGKTRWKKIRK